ncbi:MAG: hypothetical protein KF715_17500 [Candidatus Didemnitutus sp.]|nr:hypothetical protein [Candidatus Didemnitutus sp.]
MKTQATRRVLQTIVRRDYGGSQADFSTRCGLDTADTSRVIGGIRPATPGFVRRAASALSARAAAELVTAFLADVATATTDVFSVTVEVSAKRPNATLSGERDAQGNGAA